MSDKFLRDEKEQLRNAIGSELSWGWSPAVDFTRVLKGRIPAQQAAEASSNDAAAAAARFPAKSMATTSDALDASMEALEMEVDRREEQANIVRASSGDAADPPVQRVSILMAGASDTRHILRTAASLRAEQGDGKDSAAAPVEYDFYIYEPNLRTHCRHLFFLQWLLDSIFSFEELEERVLMFLEVFGNSLVREMTAAQSRAVTQRLLRCLEKESGPLASMIDFSLMKMKERDFLEEQLRHWTTDTSRAPIEEQWSTRVRQEMADRYDNRDNIIDWDFVFHLTDYTNLLKFPEYRTWRNTGLAYDVCHINPRKGFTYSYNTPNKTLCHFTRRGDGVYCGDAKNGPFFALGSTTENPHIRHRTTDGTCKYGNGVVAMHNVRAWLFTLMTGKAWPWADHAFAWDDPKNYNYLPPGTPNGVEYTATLPRMRFHFIGLNFDRFLLRCASGSSSAPRGLRMDAAFVGTSCTHLLTPAFFEKAMAPHAVVIAETAKFVVDAEDPAKEAFANRIAEMAGAASPAWEMDEAITASLHAGQPTLPKREGAETEAQRLSMKHYHYPFQLALVRPS